MNWKYYAETFLPLCFECIYLSSDLFQPITVLCHLHYKSVSVQWSPIVMTVTVQCTVK